MNMTKRAVVSALVSAPAVASLGAIARAAEPSASYVIAETASGRIRGMASEGVNAFKGIPYGAPTGGANRFQPPRPVEAWPGVRDTLVWGPSSPQHTEFQPPPGQKAPSSDMMGQSAQSEDCLVLNVWTAGLDNAKRPVMVWLHGGSFHLGSGNTEGDRLASRGDVVVVTINHRLGLLGYMYLAELGGERYAQSGNVGTLDQIAALRWVRDNISRFGGDPGNVTIFGCSGGGSKVSTLLATPAAAGLYHRAIVQSGSFGYGADPQFATKRARAAMAHLGLRPDQVDRLHDLTSEQLMKAVVPGILVESLWLPRPLPEHFQFFPVRDGRILLDDPGRAALTSPFRDTPVMIGTSRNELTAMFAGQAPWFKTMDQAGLHRMAQAHAGAQAADVLQAETDWAGPAPASVIASNIVTHRTLWRPALAQAAQRAAGAPGPVWMYRMDYASPLANGLLGAPHCGECAFAFNDVARQGRMYGYTQRDDYRPLQKAISDTWVQFAKTGDPNTPALPHWPRYTTGEQATMTLNAACKVETNPDAGLQRAWAPVPMIGGPQEIREAIVRLDSGASVVGPDPYRVRT